MRLSTPHGFFHHGPGFFHHGLFPGHDYYDEAGIHRGWVVAIGTIFLILGALGLAMVSLMTLVSVAVFGVLAIIGGFVQLSLSFMSEGTRNTWIGVALGALYVAAGLLMINNPVASSMVLTLLLAGALIGLGIARIAFWLQHRAHRYWIWSVVSGVVSILLGFLIIAQWPISALWVIGLFVSMEMIFHGAAAIGLAAEKRRLV
jgi:uncharacterized membrane protein HdeD (DUF308 family)